MEGWVNPSQVEWVLNPGPVTWQSAALPTELSWPAYNNNAPRTLLTLISLRGPAGPHLSLTGTTPMVQVNLEMVQMPSKVIGDVKGKPEVDLFCKIY